MKVKEKLGVLLIKGYVKCLSWVAPRTAASVAFRLFCTPQPPGKMRRPTFFHTAEKLDVPFRSGILRGYRWGAGNTRKALILHGFGSRAFKFHRFAEGLLKAGYEVLAFDAPAHGASSGKQVNVLDYSAMIEEVFTRFGPFDGYIAHSFGGIALCLTLEKQSFQHPCRAVLIAPATETSSAITLAFQTLGINRQRVKDHFYDLIYQHSGRKVSWFSVNRAIRNLRGSVLWVHDEHDAVTPFADTLPTRNQLPAHVQFVTTQQLGHKAIYHDKAVQQQVFDFLA